MQSVIFGVTGETSLYMKQWPIPLGPPFSKSLSLSTGSPSDPLFIIPTLRNNVIDRQGLQIDYPLGLPADGAKGPNDAHNVLEEEYPSVAL